MRKPIICSEKLLPSPNASRAKRLTKRIEMMQIIRGTHFSIFDLVFIRSFYANYDFLLSNQNYNYNKLKKIKYAILRRRNLNLILLFRMLI